MTRTDPQPMTEQGAQKQRLRASLLEQRRAIPPQDRCVWDSDIALRLLRMPEYRRAAKLLVYLSTPWEVSTAIPIAHAIGMGKQVAVPRWAGGSMEFIPFTDYRALTPGERGILQPAPDAVPLQDFEGALCLVPALGVDRMGRRIGYGGGYYDRFLHRFEGDSAVLAYDGMVLENLPTEPHDYPVHSIITPGGVYTIEEERL